MRSLNSSLICILGWLKSDLGVLLLCFGFEWKSFGEKEETTHFRQIRCSTPKRRSVRLSVGLCLSIGLRLSVGLHLSVGLCLSIGTHA